MAFSYQRKQTTVVSAICFVVVVCTIVYVYGASWGLGGPKAQSVSIADSAGSTPNQMFADTNWKNTFFSVSSSTLDAYKLDSLAKPISTTTEKLTQTDLLGRDFFSTYIQLRQAGLNTDENAVKSATNQLISDAVSNMQSPTVYSGSLLVVTDLDNKTTLMNYFSDLSSVLATNYPKTNEAVVANDALSTGNTEKLKEIDLIITKYEALIKALLIIKVPKALAPYHINLINGVSMQLFNAKALRHVDTDPVQGLAAVQLEGPALQAMSTALTDISAYLNRRGITSKY